MSGQKDHSPIDKLLALGDPRDLGAEWPDYLALGLGREHIPDLLDLLKNYDLLGTMEDTPDFWAPVHAWRALGQLRAVEAIDPLIELLAKIDTTDDDWLLEELPEVFGLIGPKAIPALAAFLGSGKHGDVSRSCAAGGIARIGQILPERRLDCLEIITGQLRQYGRNSVDLNGLLICDLLDLHAIESVEVIRGAFQARRVEIAIPGDLEDVEIELGLRKERVTPQPHYGVFGQAQEAARKVGRNDPCPCGSGKKIQEVLPQIIGLNSQE